MKWLSAIIVAFALLITNANAGGMKTSDLYKFNNASQKLIRVIVKYVDSESSLLTERYNESVLSQRKNKLAPVNDRRLDKLLQKLNSNKNLKKVGKFQDPSLFSIGLTKSELTGLILDSEVDVYENKEYRPVLSTSIPLVFSTQITSPYKGSGWAVAVLDSGVNNAHTFFGGRVLANKGACFSGNSAVNFEASTCIGEGTEDGQTSSTGASAGLACSAYGCDHGTKVAGVVAGSSIAPAQNGVATSANIIPVQIARINTDGDDCGDGLGSCVFTLTADIIRGLEYVYNNRNVFGAKVASVNLSFASIQEYPSNADCIVEDPLVETYINNLTNANIAVITPTGNDGNTSGISSPACLSNSIAVASSDDSDNPWPSNNRNNVLVDLFAPGVNVNTSTLPGNSDYAEETGTSIAAAHVAGAWAVLRSKSSFSTVSQLLSLLKSTSGTEITQGSTVKKRIDLDLALDNLDETVIDDSLCIPIKASNGKIATICL